MADDAGFAPEAAGWEHLTDEGFIGLVGPFWVRGEAGARRYGFAAEPRHANLLGVVQGGMLMTFADRAMGLEAWAAAGGRPCTTVQFATNFIAGAQIGSFITIAPRVARATRSLIFMDGALMADGVELATVQGLWKVVWRPPAN
ncbi:MAG: PaaI family thioesterase [Alphaproteobacteria bacterium]|nr:PaaI family thioesterase [Alphaproteobacteria bacterium]